MGVSICPCACYCVDCSVLYMAFLNECTEMFCAEDTLMTCYIPYIYYLVFISHILVLMLTSFYTKTFYCKDPFTLCISISFYNCLIKTTQSLVVQWLNCDSAQRGSCDGTLRSENWEVFSLNALSIEPAFKM